MKSLDEVAQDIIENPDIHDLLTDVLAGRPLRCHPFKGLVESQRDEYEKHGLDIRTQGFQTGEPWIGDIEKARILFLSSNPAFTFNENCPRYFAQTKTFAMPYSKETLSLQEVREWIHNAAQTACVAGRGLHVRTVDADGEECCKEITYWGCVRNNVERLLPNEMKGKDEKAYFRKLMSYAVCMEVVPFKSVKEAGVQEALCTCWENFARHILARAAASIFVLVGKRARDVFLEQALKSTERAEAEDCFGKDEDKDKDKEKEKNKRKIYRYEYKGGTERSVVFVESNMGKISNFKTFFPEAVLKTLQDRMSA
jgi:hypothetical protein